MAKKKVSHRARSEKFYADRGYVVTHVESKNLKVLGEAPGQPPGVMLVKFFGTQDLFGFADMAAWDASGRCVLVQYTTGDHHAARRTKVKENAVAVELGRRGVGIHVLSWAKPAGKRIYAPRLEVLFGDPIACDLPSKTNPKARCCRYHHHVQAGQPHEFFDDTRRWEEA